MFKTSRWEACKCGLVYERPENWDWMSESWKYEVCPLCRPKEVERRGVLEWARSNPEAVRACRAANSAFYGMTSVTSYTTGKEPVKKRRKKGGKK